jgi:hypothetical protein
MVALAQTIEHLIEEQVNDGSAHSEIEAEQMIISVVAERVIDRKIAKSQEQVRNGQYSEFNDEFMTNLLAQAKTRHSV